MLRLLQVLALLCILTDCCQAQSLFERLTRGFLSDSEPVPVAPEPVPPVPVGTSHALVLVGLPGDAERQTRFAESVDKITTALTTHLGFETDNVHVLFADQKAIDAGESLPTGATLPCTIETIQSAVDNLRQKLAPHDTLWVIVMGHSHFDGRRIWFNISGDDFNEVTFGKLFEGIVCARQVYWITIPASGFYVKPLSAEGRIIIAATEADRELNETEFPHALAATLAEPPTLVDFDMDRDGNPTLFDLYLNVVKRVMQGYADENLLSTEHAKLDDNGDGRGRELQIDYLTEPLGGRLAEGAAPPQPSQLENLDGRIAREYLLPTDFFPDPLPVPPPVEAAPGDVPVDPPSDPGT